MNKEHKEGCCERNCPDFNGMEILHKEQCDCSCHQEEKTTTEWEKEFEKLMPKTSGETMSYGQFCAVRNFIRQLLLQERKRMVEKVEGGRHWEEALPEPHCNDCVEKGRCKVNQTIDHIKALLTDKEE